MDTKKRPAEFVVNSVGRLVCRCYFSSVGFSDAASLFSVFGSGDGKALIAAICSP